MAQSLVQISTELQQHQAECTQKYVAALHSATPDGAEEKLTEAYHVLAEAIGSQDPEKIAEAQAHYVEILGKVTSVATDEANAAIQDCASDFEGATAEAHRHGQKQYFQYVDTLKSILAKASDKDLSPGTLTMMAHNMASAAALSQGLFAQSE